MTLAPYLAAFRADLARGTNPVRAARRQLAKLRKAQKARRR
jgi:hypothetical protein